MHVSPDPGAVAEPQYAPGEDGGDFAAALHRRQGICVRAT